MLIHPIAPVFDKDSRVLILGSFPSVKSREEGFFYGHPQNRFWKVTASIFGEDVPKTIDEKKSFLLKNHIALWDVIGSCEIDGSSDSSIRNVSVNDIKNDIGNSRYSGDLSQWQKSIPTLSEAYAPGHRTRGHLPAVNESR